MIRDIAKLPTTPTRNMSLSTVAHFRPHSHPLSCLTFNAAGTLLLSASKQGHTFHIFGVLPSNNVVGNISHLYSLARGYTDAQVEDCQFSADSMWCSVSTARGTTHVYAINPYGGKPEIMGHVVGKVNNPPVRLFMNQQRKLEKVCIGIQRCIIQWINISFFLLLQEYIPWKCGACQTTTTHDNRNA